MVFWLLAAGIVAVSLFFLLRGLALPVAAVDARADDIAFYRSQQAELERQLSSGAIDAVEAKAADAEAARRLLARTRAVADGPIVDTRRVRLAQLVTAMAVPVVALPLYLQLGAPNVPGQPFAQRTDLDQSQRDLARLIERLDAHLADAPDDLRGNELAFPVYMKLGRFADAATVAARILRLKGESAEGLTAFAEAKIFAEKGLVDDESRAALQRALAVNPDFPRALFYNGLAIEQAGEPQKALAIWRALAARLPDGAEKRAVTTQIARLAPNGPQGEAADAIRQLPQGEQANAIRAMVGGLESRLQQQGGSAEDWQRLVRALAVLGEKDRAGVALKAARQQHATDTAAMATLQQLATELSLEGNAQ